MSSVEHFYPINQRNQFLANYLHVNPGIVNIISDYASSGDKCYDNYFPMVQTLFNEMSIELVYDEKESCSPPRKLIIQRYNNYFYGKYEKYYPDDIFVDSIVRGKSLELPCNHPVIKFFNGMDIQFVCKDIMELASENWAHKLTSPFLNKLGSWMTRYHIQYTSK